MFQIAKDSRRSYSNYLIIPQCLITFKPFLRSNYGFFYATKTLPLYQKKGTSRNGDSNLSPRLI